MTSTQRGLAGLHRRRPVEQADRLGLRLRQGRARHAGLPGHAGPAGAQPVADQRRHRRRLAVAGEPGQHSAAESSRATTGSRCPPSWAPTASRRARGSTTSPTPAAPGSFRPRALHILVGESKLPDVGTRPTVPADDTITIEHSSGTKITVAADGAALSITTNHKRSPSATASVSPEARRHRPWRCRDGHRADHHGLHSWPARTAAPCRSPSRQRKLTVDGKPVFAAQRPAGRVDLRLRHEPSNSNPRPSSARPWYPCSAAPARRLTVGRRGGRSTADAAGLTDGFVGGARDVDVASAGQSKLGGPMTAPRADRRAGGLRPRARARRRRPRPRNGAAGGGRGPGEPSAGPAAAARHPVGERPLERRATAWTSATRFTSGPAARAGKDVLRLPIVRTRLAATRGSPKSTRSCSTTTPRTSPPTPDAGPRPTAQRAGSRSPVTPVPRCPSVTADHAAAAPSDSARPCSPT